MVPFGRILLVRTALLVVIAFCIVTVVVSEDRDVRLLVATTAIIVEIIRDAILVSGIKGGKT